MAALGVGTVGAVAALVSPAHHLLSLLTSGRNSSSWMLCLLLAIQGTQQPSRVGIASLFRPQPLLPALASGHCLARESRMVTRMVLCYSATNCTKVGITASKTLQCRIFYREVVNGRFFQTFMRIQLHAVLHRPPPLLTIHVAGPRATMTMWNIT